MACGSSKLYMQKISAIANFFDRLLIWLKLPAQPNRLFQQALTIAVLLTDWQTAVQLYLLVAGCLVQCGLEVWDDEAAGNLSSGLQDECVSLGSAHTSRCLDNGNACRVIRCCEGCATS